ncbi:hypothetical protein Nham_1966 [Nitrobacter hamburgensis X14]|uniref:Uncharacterized protein n=1 Tax=Nitrobacter hamburgensis (strain DSM 10229 / NCIMB 13809 / X14) TaxID=323097 RepID=Q1QLX9_NITHX|nr:hypothetical protein Nham_1966 [Nitrobacter hamburgensis X14]
MVDGLPVDHGGRCGVDRRSRQFAAPRQAIQGHLSPAYNLIRIRFTPAILPPYVRRSKSIETLLPILYLKGIAISSMRLKSRSLVSS